MLPDIIVNNLPNTVKHISAYNYKIQNWEQTYEIADNFIEKVQKDRNKSQYEGSLIRSFESAGSLYKITSGSACIFPNWDILGVIFFIGAGSVLYFRMYTDLTNEQEKYITISKIGVTDTEMKRSATIQLSILFFIPYIMASIHTMFATKMLQDVIGLSLFKEVSAVLIILDSLKSYFSYSFVHFICKNYHITRVDKIFKTNLMKRVFLMLFSSSPYQEVQVNDILAVCI